MFELIEYISCGKFESRGEWTHPDRIMTSHELIFVIKGEVYLKEGDGCYALKAGDFIHLEPSLRHYGTKTTTNTSFYWMHFEGSFEHPFPKTGSASNFHDITLLFNQILHYSTDSRPKEILNYLCRIILSEAMVGINSFNRTAGSVAQWINANADQPLTASYVASVFGYNSDYLNRLFKTHYNSTLKGYISLAKLNHIKNLLLNTELSLMEISNLSGFSDYKYFLKFFTYNQQMTPTQFRNTYTKKYINNK